MSHPVVRGSWFVQTFPVTRLRSKACSQQVQQLAGRRPSRPLWAAMLSAPHVEPSSSFTSPHLNPRGRFALPRDRFWFTDARMNFSTRTWVQPVPHPNSLAGGGSINQVRARSLHHPLAGCTDPLHASLRSPGSYSSPPILASRSRPALWMLRTRTWPSSSASGALQDQAISRSREGCATPGRTAPRQEQLRPAAQEGETVGLTSTHSSTWCGVVEALAVPRSGMCCSAQRSVAPCVRALDLDHALDLALDLALDPALSAIGSASCMSLIRS